MLCVLLIAFIVSVSGQVAKNELRCTLPALPKHGSYLIETDTDGGSPGDKVKSFRLRMTCSAGYKGVGSDTMTCTEDGRVLQTDFECLPYCERSNEILTCGAETRCVLDLEKSSFIAKDNVWQNNGECGVSGPAGRSRRQSTQKGTIIISDAAPFVSGGLSANRGEFPWHAGVYSKKTQPYMQMCGGTLISPRVIVSAAHCFWSEVEGQQPAAGYAVAVGKLYRPWNEAKDNNAQKSDVAEIRIPSYFHGHITNLQEDIALLIVASPFTITDDVRPVCLSFDLEFDQRQLRPNTLGYAVGWGLTTENGGPSPVLKKAFLPVIAAPQCFQLSSPQFRTHITSDKFCAGWTNGTAVCQGDSGGGFVISEFNEVSQRSRYYLRGVVSGAPQSDYLCNVYSWASFTRVLNHERFIKDTLAEFRV